MPHKLYKKQYEDVFMVDKKGYVFDPDAVSGLGLNFDEYTDLFKGCLRPFYNDLYIFFIRLSWFRRNFIYKGKKAGYPIRKSGTNLCSMFVKYLRRVVGMDIQIFTRGMAFSAIESYFDVLYPGFDDGNPFENPEYYDFPFKNISLEFLVVVNQIDERMLLLEEAEKQKLSYAAFLDLIVNHVHCVNDELGRIKYETSANTDSRISFFVRNVDKTKKRYESKK